MDESKRDIINKTKRTKSDHVKLIMSSYFQKRNYPFPEVSNISKNEFLLKTLIQDEVRRPNSVLYSCYNSDPAAIDQSFNKFLTWLKDLTKNKKTCFDLEQLLPPLFCHLYLEILKAGHSEKAATFFKVHSQTVDKVKCDDLIKELINSFTNDINENYQKEQFRANKYTVSLSQGSANILKKFVTENCHVVFLQVLQNWFDIHEIEEEVTAVDESMVVSIERENLKFQELKNVMNELKKEPKPLLCVNIANTKEEIGCAFMKRSSGIIAYSQNNSVHVLPIHPYDSVVYHKNSNKLCFNGHHGKVYDLVISTCNEYLVTGSADHNVCIFDLVNATLQYTCKGHLGPVYCVSVSSPASYAASGSYDTTARLWSTDKGHMVRVFIGHSQPITCIQFHPNNVYLATGSADRTVRLWNIESGKTERLFQAAKGIIFAIAFHPLGQYIASASDDKRIHVWDILQSKMLLELKYKEDIVTKLIWSKDGRYLSAGTISGVFRMWDFDGIQENNNTDVKFYEPSMTLKLHCKLLHIEYSCDSFACVTS